MQISGPPAPRPNEYRRVMIFIDGSNLYWGMKYYNQEKKTAHAIDFSKLISELNGGRTLIRAYYYGSYPIPILGDQQALYDDLVAMGVRRLVFPLKQRKDSKSGKKYYVEKGVDVGLATDLLSLAWEDAYDEAVVVSGDGDLAGAVEKVSSKGKNVHIAAFKRTLSGKLKESGDKKIYLDEILPKIVK